MQRHGRLRRVHTVMLHAKARTNMLDYVQTR